VPAAFASSEFRDLPLNRRLANDSNMQKNSRSL